MQQLTNVQAIKQYFEKDGRKVELKEMKELTKEDREELGKLALHALSIEK